MRLILTTIRQPPYLFAGSVLLVPAVALAADAVLAHFEPTTARFWTAWFAVQVLSAIGYGASSLPELANWVDAEGSAVDRLKRRYKIIQGCLLAVLAGNVGYFGGMYYMGVSEIGCFIATSVCAYGGDKFISPLLSRITGKALE